MKPVWVRLTEPPVEGDRAAQAAMLLILVVIVLLSGLGR